MIFIFKGLVPAVFSGRPSCSTTDTPTPIPDDEMIAENWDPFVLRDGNVSSCLHFPFLSHETIYFKITLPQVTRMHNVFEMYVMETLCSPTNSYVMTETYDICTNIAPIFRGPDIICRHKCHLMSEDSFISLVVANKEIQICEIKF